MNKIIIAMVIVVIAIVAVAVLINSQRTPVSSGTKPLVQSLSPQNVAQNAIENELSSVNAGQSIESALIAG